MKSCATFGPSDLAFHEDEDASSSLVYTGFPIEANVEVCGYKEAGVFT